MFLLDEFRRRNENLYTVIQLVCCIFVPYLCCYNCGAQKSRAYDKLEDDGEELNTNVAEGKEYNADSPRTIIATRLEQVSSAETTVENFAFQ